MWSVGYCVLVVRLFDLVWDGFGDLVILVVC